MFGLFKNLQCQYKTRQLLFMGKDNIIAQKKILLYFIDEIKVHFFKANGEKLGHNKKCSFCSLYQILFF